MLEATLLQQISSLAVLNLWDGPARSMRKLQKQPFVGKGASSPRVAPSQATARLISNRTDTELPPAVLDPNHGVAMWRLL